MTMNYPTYSLEESSIIMNQILDQQFKLLWKQVPSCTPSISVACQSSQSPSPIDLLDNILSQFDTFFDDDIFNNDVHLPDTKATEYNDDTLPMTSYNSPLISNDISEIGTSNTLSSTQYFDAKSDSAFEAHHSKQDFDISYYSASYALDFYHPGTSLEFNQDHYFTFAPSPYIHHWRLAPFSPHLSRVDPLLRRPNSGKDPPF